jgi:hypothetical protein
MTDTTEEARLKQLEIIYSKTPQERFLMGVEMIDSVRSIVESSIRSEKPGISNADLAAAVFKRYYLNDFPPDELEEIARQIREYHLKSEAGE